MGNRLMVIDAPGMRRKGRLKRRWMDSIKDALRQKGFLVEEAQDRAAWGRMVSNIDLT